MESCNQRVVEHEWACRRHDFSSYKRRRRRFKNFSTTLFKIRTSVRSHWYWGLPISLWRSWTYGSRNRKFIRLGIFHNLWSLQQYCFWAKRLPARGQLWSDFLGFFLRYGHITRRDYTIDEISKSYRRSIVLIRRSWTCWD